ncbi:MAG: hypothetical protein ABI551_25765 [Polyangiaceae bacterium]
MDPLSDDVFRRLVRGYGDFVAEHGEAIGNPDLVLPNEDFFPDELTPDAHGVEMLLARMLSYAPLSPALDVRLRFVEGDSGESSSCGPCGCGPKAGPTKGITVVDAGDGYLIDLDVSDVRHPVVLTTALARAIGTLVVHEAGDEVAAVGVPARSEIAAVASGFGALLANGAYIYGKSCGGASVVQATRHSVEELAHLLALFVRHHELKPSGLRAVLELTPREAFDHALARVDSNDEITTALREHPASIAAGYFKVLPTKLSLGRLFA